MKRTVLIEAMLELTGSDEADSLVKIVECVSKYYQMPVLVCTIDYVLLAQFPNSPINDAGWNMFLEQQIASPEYLREVMDSELMSQSFEANTAFFSESQVSNHEPRIISPIRINQSVVGYLVIFWRKDQVYSAEEQELVLSISLAIAIEFRKRSTGNFTVNPATNLFLKNLLEGRLVTTPDIEQWGKLADVDIGGRYGLIAVIQPNSTETSLKQLLVKLNLTVDQGPAQILSIALQNRVYLLVTRIESKEELLPIFHMLEENQLYYGASELFSDLLTIMMVKRQADDTVAYAEKRQQAGPIFYEDVMLPILLERMEHVFSENFYHSSLAKISHFDHQNGTPYYDTLKHYVLNFFSISETAKELFIHRNTMTYRLAKISEISGLNFNDPQVKVLLLMNIYYLK
ncbi:helix-turn-helix domain-containing protein [Vagococcus sp. BWB3-3]|uniref:Helix-turn-helix domain-containing protein n=1 Tax=Vagococcus allomyrinae TaxID=2794353 RepID=A0A940P8E3_9ENTE|nr:helix-turn-helix domain-containing protein [Vagococcus allomyrinae]MBP1040329.1 helix-turn-helix domain-containing protein [Vagococcus allomyrinae]